MKTIFGGAVSLEDGGSQPRCLHRLGSRGKSKLTRNWNTPQTCLNVTKVICKQVLCKFSGGRYSCLAFMIREVFMNEVAFEPDFESYLGL